MEVHLPCPALHEWLPTLLDGKRVAAWDPSDAPRRVRSVLRRWPAVELEPSTKTLELDALLFGVTLERPAPPDAALAALAHGAWIIELAVPRRRVLRSLFGLGLAPIRPAASQARTLQWLARGCFELEQWETVEPVGVVVTLARVRR